MSRREPQTITDRLAHIVQRAGGPSAVAKRLGVTPPAVRAWTLGSVPYHDHLMALCDEFHVSLDWLKTGEGEEDAEFSKTAKIMEASSLPVRETEDLARSLAEMIVGFASLPAAYESLALRQIEEHFAEFCRRARMRADARRPSASYRKSNHSKK